MYDEDLDDALDECRGLIDDYDSQLSDLEEQEYELDIADLEYERENDSRIIAARNEELAAYADFIASMDMDD